MSKSLKSWTPLCERNNGQQVSETVALARRYRHHCRVEGLVVLKVCGASLPLAARRPGETKVEGGIDGFFTPSRRHNDILGKSGDPPHHAGGFV